MKYWGDRKLNEGLIKSKKGSSSVVNVEELLRDTWLLRDKGKEKERSVDRETVETKTRTELSGQRKRVKTIGQMSVVKVPKLSLRQEMLNLSQTKSKQSLETDRWDLNTVESPGENL